MYRVYDGGWFELICGSMFSGKTEELIRRLVRVQIAGVPFQVFKHRIDVRYDAQKVNSHSGSAMQAIAVNNAFEIGQLILPETIVVGIDEIQFFDWQIADLIDELVARGVRVIGAGLPLDFRAEPFGPMPLLLAQADEVVSLSAICKVPGCMRQATRTQRLIDGRPARYDEPVILVGAAESYEARCRRHHEVPKE